MRNPPRKIFNRMTRIADSPVNFKEVKGGRKKEKGNLNPQNEKILITKNIPCSTLQEGQERRTKRFRSGADNILCKNSWMPGNISLYAQLALGGGNAPGELRQS